MHLLGLRGLVTWLGWPGVGLSGSHSLWSALGWSLLVADTA